MWALFSRKTQVLLVAGGGILIAWALDGLFALYTGHPAGLLKWISLSATIVGTLIAAVASALWRPIWRLFPWIEKRTFPDLTGTWKGHLVSTWIDPATGQPKAPIPTTVTITQGLFATTVRLQTGESTSYSVRCLLEPYPDAGRFRIWYSYNNDPKAQYRYRSSPHQGIAWLEMDYDGDPDHLVGMYYTERKTSGDLDVRRPPRRRDK